MQLEEARVRGFRNIKDSGWVDIHEDVTTLVGKNESGKTSFLEAVGRLSDTDRIEKDDINNGIENADDSLPVVQAKFSGSGVLEGTRDNEGIVYKRRDGKLRATKNLGFSREKIFLWENQIRYFEDRFGISDPEVRFTEDKYNIINKEKKFVPNKINLFDKKLTRENIIEKFNQIEKQIESPGLKQDIESFIDFLKRERPDIVSIADILPNFVYSEDISIISDTCGREALSEEESAPFRRLLTFGEINYQEYCELDKKSRLIQRVNAQRKIKNYINKFWSQKSFEIRLQYSERDDEFLLMIRDTGLPNDSSEGSLELDRSLTELSKRSRGFRWFFSFFVNHVSRENSVDEASDTVYLVDDPAVYLHPEGKKNWIETIEDLTDNAQFLYSSHSPFLIDETRPERIRIVEDSSGNRTQITDNIFEGNRETLEPLRNALGIGLGDSPFANRRKILVEGPSDYFILSGVLSYFDEHEDDAPLSSGELTLFPVDGADEMPEAGRWMHSEEFAFVFLLDDDEKGTAVEEVIENDELLDTSNLFFLEHDRAKNSYNVEIEDMFHPEFYVDCVNEVYSRDHFCSNIEDGDNEIDDLDLDQIEVTEVDDGWLLNDREEYKGMKIVSKVEAEFSNQGYDSLELDKLTVAKEVQNRLERGDGFREEDVDAFKSVLGPMNSTLYTN